MGKKRSWKTPHINKNQGRWRVKVYVILASVLKKLVCASHMWAVQTLHHLKLEENIFYRRVGCTFGIEFHTSLCPDPAMLCQIHGTLTALAQLAQNLVGTSQAFSWKHVSIHNRLALLEKHRSEQASLGSEVLSDACGQPSCGEIGTARKELGLFKLRGMCDPDQPKWLFTSALSSRPSESTSKRANSISQST